MPTAKATKTAAKSGQSSVLRTTTTRTTATTSETQYRAEARGGGRSSRMTFSEVTTVIMAAALVKATRCDLVTTR